MISPMQSDALYRALPALWPAAQADQGLCSRAALQGRTPKPKRKMSCAGMSSAAAAGA